MNDEQFQKELAKYKVVRRADHHKIREKQKRVASVKPVTGAANTVSATSRVPTRPSTGQAAEFWALLESTVASSGILSQSETDQFIQKLRKEQEIVSRQVNLDDLNAMCKG